MVLRNWSRLFFNIIVSLWLAFLRTADIKLNSMHPLTLRLFSFAFLIVAGTLEHTMEAGTAHLPVLLLKVKETLSPDTRSWDIFQMKIIR